MVVFWRLWAGGWDEVALVFLVNVCICYGGGGFRGIAVHGYQQWLRGGRTYVVAARGSCQLRFGASAVTARVFGPRAWLRGL